MKKSLLSILFLCMSLLCNAQLDREAMERERMRENNVQVCTQYTHKYRKGKPDSEGYKACETTYNRQGNPVLVINFRSNGKVSSKLYYSYDDLGRRTEYRKEEPMGSNGMKVSFCQKFTYDRRGNKLTESGFDGSSTYLVKYTYMPNGRQRDITRINGDNSISERWMFTYNGNQQTIHVTPKNGSPYTVVKITSLNGKLLSDTHFDDAGREIKKVEYTYDPAGRLQVEKRSYGGALKQTLKYVFYKDGQLAQILQKNSGGEQYVNNDYTYDQRGNLVVEQWADGNPNLISKKDSEYDGSGNMVRVESFYAPYRYRVMYTYKYQEF